MPFATTACCYAHMCIMCIIMSYKAINYAIIYITIITVCLKMPPAFIFMLKRMLFLLFA